MAVYWPSGLPDAWLAGVRITAVPQLARTQMDAGPAKVRRRGSAIVRDVSARVRFTGRQVETFDAWYHEDLEGGALRFGHRHPVTRAPADFRFKAPPAWDCVVPGDLDGSLWEAAFELELLP